MSTQQKIIRFEPTPKQFQAWEFLNDDETTELGFGGAAGGGKSWLGCFWIFAQCKAYPGTRWLIGRKELINLKRTTLKTLFKIFAKYEQVGGVDFFYNQQTNTITFNNKTKDCPASEIVLFDLSSSPLDPEYTRLGSLELTGAFVDESNEVEAKAITILSTRLGRQFNDKYNIRPKLLESFNPNKGHVYLRYYKPWKSNVLPPHRKFIKSLATDNPYLTEDYLEQLRNSDKATRERLLEGNFEYSDDPNILMGYDEISDLFTNTVDDSEERYMIVDAARFGGDLIVIMCWRGFNCYRTFYMAKTGLDVSATQIRTMASEEQIPWSRILIDETGVGGGLCDMLKGTKGFIGGSSPLPRNKLEEKPEFFNNLRSQCFFELASYVNDHRIALAIEDPTIRDRIALELQQVKQINVDKGQKNQIISKDEMKKALGHSPDFADALSMRMFFAIKPIKAEDKFREKTNDWMDREMKEFKKQSKKTLASKL